MPSGGSILRTVAAIERSSPPQWVTRASLANKDKEKTMARASTRANSNAVDLLKPTADLPTAIKKLNELINAMRR